MISAKQMLQTLGLVVLASVAGCTNVSNRKAMTTGGEVCAAGGYCALECRIAPSRCSSYTFRVLTHPAGFSTAYSTWWVRPQSGAVGVPIYVIPGLTLNQGYHRMLDFAEALADGAQRPVALLTTMVHGTQSEVQGGSGGGDIFGGRWINDLYIGGANLASITWDAHFPAVDAGACSTCYMGGVNESEVPCCPGGGTVTYTGGGCRCLDCRGGFYETVGNGAGAGGVQACYLETRIAGWDWSSTRAIVDGWQELVNRGVVAATAQFDVVGHSAGGVRIAGALVNTMGYSTAPYTTFHQKARHVITVNAPHLGVVDGAQNDGIEFRTSGLSGLARKEFIRAHRGHPALANVHWWALASYSYATDGTLTSNYQFGREGNMGWLANFCGSRNWYGDGTLPYNSGFSPWPNSHGLARSQACGLSALAYRTTAGWWASPITFDMNLGPPRTLMPGDHLWYLRPAAMGGGMDTVLQTLGRAAGYTAGERLASEGISCYTGPAGTLDVAICRGGFRYETDSSSVCREQVLPQSEVCGDSVDNNCNGQLDETCPPPPEGHGRDF